MFKKSIPMALFAAASLVACGGGHDVPVINVNPEGFWTGTASNDMDVAAVVLENGEVWGASSKYPYIYGALHGTVKAEGAKLKVTGTSFDFVSRTASPFAATGNIHPPRNMFLDDGDASMTLKYDASYEKPATAKAITGAWLLQGQTTNFAISQRSITIDGDGAFTSADGSCVTTGSVKPRPGGKNVYNAIVKSDGADCILGREEMVGVAVIDTTKKPSQFVLIAKNQSQTDGLLISGVKH